MKRHRKITLFIYPIIFFLIASYFSIGYKPTSVKAVDCPVLSVGKVIKSKLDPALYTVVGNNKISAWFEGWHGRTNFTNSNSQSGNFAEGDYPAIELVDPSCLSQYQQILKPVPVRPGSFPFYRPNTNDLYYSVGYFKLKKISTKAAEKYFGQHQWKKMDVQSWLYYTVENGLIDENSSLPGNLLINNGTKYYVVNENDNSLEEVTSQGINENKFNIGYAYRIDNTVMNKYKFGSNKISNQDNNFQYFAQITNINSSQTTIQTQNTNNITSKFVNGYYAWGSNSDGVFGNGNNGPSKNYTPEKVSRKFKKIVLDRGGYTVYAIDTNGGLWGWGQRTTSIMVEHFKYGPAFTTPQPIHVGMQYKIVDIAAGWDYLVILDEKGHVFSMGTNSGGELGYNPSKMGYSAQPIEIEPQYFGNEKVVQLAIAQKRNFALTETGKLYGWGSHNGACGLGYGDDFVIDITKQNDSLPQLVKNNSGTNFKDISAAGYFTLALDTNGHVWAWGGDNSNYELGQNLGTVYASCEMKMIPHLDNVVEIEAGYFHGLAIDDKGNVWGWGRNIYGQVGIPQSTPFVDHPVLVYSGGDAYKLAAAKDHSILLRTDGRIMTWGDNHYGQLGNGNSAVTSSYTPTLINLPSDIFFNKLSTDYLTIFAY